MSTIFKNGIGYHIATKAAFYTDGNVLTATPEPAGYSSSSLWAPWGPNNREPLEIADDIENTPVLSAATKATARLAVGRGLAPYLLVDRKADGEEVTESVIDSQIEDWLDDNQHFLYSYCNIRNQVGYGWGATQFVLNRGLNYINRIKATDVVTARLEKMTSQGIIPNLYLCGDWEAAPSTYDTNKMRRIPVLREGYELQDLQEATGNIGEYAILHRLLENGKLYYPTPAHRSAKAWVKISRSIPALKNAMNINQMHIKYLIRVSPTYFERVNPDWKKHTTEQKEAFVQSVYDNISDFLTGEQNAGKTITSGKFFDPVNKVMINDIDIEVIDDKMKEGRWLPDNAAADKQILFSMMFNPAIWGGNLLGDGASGGAGSGSDIREATLVLMLLLHPERMSNLRTLDIVKKFNGWSKRLEIARDVFAVTAPAQTNTASMSRKKITSRLVFRYSSSILTTLDTGKSTAPTNL